jgi:hypothetical protein
MVDAPRRESAHSRADDRGTLATGAWRAIMPANKNKGTPMIATSHPHGRRQKPPNVTSPAARRFARPRREALAASYVALAVAVITAVLFTLLRA